MDNTIPEVNPGIPHQPNAVSVYGQADALDDFPVLKAFQQYIDAEQAKAHKRLMTVCAFFTILMTIVISVFVFIIVGQNSRPGWTDPNMMALAEANSAMQRQMLEQSARLNEQLMTQLMNRAVQQPAASAIDAEVQKKNLELQARLQALEIEKRLAAKAAAEAAQRPTPSLSDAEKVAKEEELKKKEAQQTARDAKLKEREAKLAEEAKRLKEKEIDLQRRNLYPSAYSPEAREKANQEIRAAQEESAKAKAQAREAEEKALEAERRAQAAIEKAEDAEREALLKSARLDVEAKRLAAESRKLEAARAVAEITPVPLEAEDIKKPAVQVDEVLQFLDEIEADDVDDVVTPHQPTQSQPKVEPAPLPPTTPTPAPVGGDKADDGAYDIPLE